MVDGPSSRLRAAFLDFRICQKDTYENWMLDLEIETLRNTTSTHPLSIPVEKQCLLRFRRHDQRCHHHIASINRLPVLLAVIPTLLLAL
jgi:hypothetical protein